MCGGRAGLRKRRRRRCPGPTATRPPARNGRCFPGISGRPRTRSRPVRAAGHPAAAPAGRESNPDSYSFSSLPYFAAIIAASLCLALRYWVCEVFSVMPSSRAISRWDRPSRQKRLTHLFEICTFFFIERL